jgi:hypothetical protein
MHEQETSEISGTPTAVEAGLRKEPHQERPPVRLFDPHFENLSGDSGRDHRDFDEMMWARVA